MDKRQKHNLIDSIDYTTIVLIGILCFLYSRYIRWFAEIHIQLPGLDFPIFIGEIVLGLCLLGFIAKFIIDRNSIKFTWFSWLIIAFFIFILAKAFYGYFKWGPLAFRHAALFYYTLYAIIGYHIYRSDFFGNKFVRPLLLLSFVAIIFLGLVHKTYYFTYFMLALVFFMGIKNKILRYISIILFIAICYYGYTIFYGSKAGDYKGMSGLIITIIGGRDIMLSSFLAYIFLFIILILGFINIPRVYKKLSVALILILLPLLIWNTAYKTSVRTLISFAPLSKIYRDSMKEVDERREGFKFADPPVKLYDESPWSQLKAGEPEPKPIEPEPDQREILLAKFQGMDREKLIENILKDMPKPPAKLETQPQLLESKLRQKEMVIAKLKAEIKAKEEIRARLEAEIKAKEEAETKREAEWKARIEAEQKAREEARVSLEAQIRAKEKARARLDAEIRAKEQAEAERRARVEAEEMMVASLPAEPSIKPEIQAVPLSETKTPEEPVVIASSSKPKRKVEEKTKGEAGMKLEAEIRAKEEAMAKLEAEMRDKEQARARLEARMAARERTEAKREAERKAKVEAEIRAKEEARAKLEAEMRDKEQARARLEAKIRANKEAEAKRKTEEEMVIASLQSMDREKLIEIVLKDLPESTAELKTKPKVEDLPKARQESIIYRVVMWRDMFEELFDNKKILGLDFGKPFRSKRAEILRMDWSWRTRTGWNTPHNAHVNILYRAGIIGALFILTVWGLFIKMVISFCKSRDIKGIFLTSALLYWLIITNFSVTLELPYWAIPFWSLFGMVYKYFNEQKIRS